MEPEDVVAMIANHLEVQPLHAKPMSSTLLWLKTVFYAQLLEKSKKTQEKSVLLESNSKTKVKRSNLSTKSSDRVSWQVAKRYSWLYPAPNSCKMREEKEPYRQLKRNLWPEKKKNHWPENHLSRAQLKTIRKKSQSISVSRLSVIYLHLSAAKSKTVKVSAKLSNKQVNLRKITVKFWPVFNKVLSFIRQSS